MNETGHPWNSKSDALYRVSVLRSYLFSVFFLIFTDHECLQQISKIGESKPHTQRWMGFLSAYNYRLSYRRGRDNANADFLFRLLIPPTADDISGSSALTDPDDLGVYLMRACGYTTASCPTSSVGLGGLTTSFYSPNTGQNSSPTPALGGLPLTKDDFRTHRAPMPLNRMTGPTASRSAIATDKSWFSYAIDDHNEAPRSNCARHTRSRTATLTGKTPLRPDYRMADRRVFAASTAPSPPPKSTLHLSPPPRSARLGSTIPLRRPTPPRMATAPNPQMDHSPSVAPPAQRDATSGDKTSTVAEQQLYNTLLGYIHSDWDKTQRADPLCDAARRYIQRGRPNPLPRSFCDHHLPHTRRPKSLTSPTSPRKAAYYRGVMTPNYWFGNPSPTP